MSEREMTYGEKAVGLTINPSGNPEVNRIKEHYASIIDAMHNMRQGKPYDNELARIASIAITEAQTAQMWAVKALTWGDK